MAKTSLQRKVVIFLGTGTLAFLALAVLSFWSSIAPRFVTWWAFQDAEDRAAAIVLKVAPSLSRLFEFRLFQRTPPLEETMESAAQELPLR